jgi:hypothetical protein
MPTIEEVLSQLYKSIEAKRIPSAVVDLRRLVALGFTEITEIFATLEGKDSKFKLEFSKKLITESFYYRCETILDFLNTSTTSFNLEGCIAEFTSDELEPIATNIVRKKFDSDFVIQFVNYIKPHENKAKFCEKLLIKSGEYNYIGLVNELFRHNESTAFLEIITNFSEVERKLIIHKALSVSINPPKDIQLIKNGLEKFYSHESDLTFYNELVIESFNQYNIPLLKALSSFKEPFNNATNNLDQTKLNKFLQLNDHDSAYIQKMMIAFCKGYGNIKYNDVLLSLAQRRQRKKYNFEPVVLGAGEFDKFLAILSSADKPIRQLFVCTGDHFISGEILIEANGKAKIFVIDSLGTDYWVNSDELLVNFAVKFPSHELFVSKEKRQNASEGCSVFALDDVAHLANLHITGPMNEQQSIWTYLNSEKNSAETKNITAGGHSASVYVAQLPLSLTRTMQSARVFELIQQKNEIVRNSPVNKKMQTAEYSVHQFFKKTTPGDDKPKNTRLDYKLSRMIEQNWAYLQHHTESDVEEAMSHFTLAAFEARITRNKLEAGNPSCARNLSNKDLPEAPASQATPEAVPQETVNTNGTEAEMSPSLKMK